MVHGLPVQGQCREARATPRDGEARNDLAARLRDRRRERSELRAIDLDGEGGQLALRIQALRIGEAVEPDSLVVEDRGEAGSRETRNGRGGFGEVRHLVPATARHVQCHDLDRLAVGTRSEIGEDDTPTVRAERESWEYIGIEADYTGPVRLELKARVAARRTKPTKPAAICSHEEEPWLLWRRERQVEQGHVAALLEHHPLPIRAHPAPLKAADRNGSRPYPDLPVDPAEPERVRHRLGTDGHDRNGITVSAADFEGLASYLETPRVRVALGHHIGEGPYGRTAADSPAG